MECAAERDISFLYFKSMATVRVCERGRENEREREKERDGVWAYLCRQIVQCVTMVCNGEGTWAQAQMNCVADWTVSCNYLPCTFWTTTVIYPPPPNAFLSLLSFQISPANVNRLWLSLCQCRRPHNGSLTPHI